MSETKLNIFQRMQAARCKLQALTLTKSGENKFAGYKYYELGDILPAINNINLELGLCTQVTFDKEYARLFVHDAENGEGILSIEFTSPLSSAQLKGAHPIQNLGATETYQRRYLYMSAYEIVEHDAVDSSKGATPPPQKVFDVVGDAKKDLQTKIDICNSLQELTDTHGKAVPVDHIASDPVKEMFSTKKKNLIEQLKGAK
jgi:hypothetical protein